MTLDQGVKRQQREIHPFYLKSRITRRRRHLRQRRLVHCRQTGSLKTNNIIASNVTVSTTYDKSSISRNSLDLNNVFNSPYNDGRSSSSAINPFRLKNLQVVMEESNSSINSSRQLSSKAVVDRQVDKCIQRWQLQ